MISTLLRTTRSRPLLSAARAFSSDKSMEGSTPQTFSQAKMATDKRYQPTSEIPSDILNSTANVSQAFSIKGAAAAGRPFYLDMQSTTPLDPRVLDKMLPHMLSKYGNPHSRTHAYGWEAEEAVEVARAQVANLIGASGKEVVFTSGATESNNMAIKGVANFYGKGSKKHIITTSTEHKCVLDSCRSLETSEEGANISVTYLPVERSTGLVNLEQLKAAIRPGETCLVSIMAINNEIGTLQPLKEIGDIIKPIKGCYFHTDAAQMIGKMPIDVNAMGIDLMSISSHKLYGPKGVGALYVRRRPRVRLAPMMSGGGQERGLRSGTLPHPLIAGFGAACELSQYEMKRDSKWINHLSERLKAGITSRIDSVVFNGSQEDVSRYPGCLNCSFAYVEGESLLMALKNVAVSSGSACTSASLEPSYVLRALGVDDELAHSSLRFGIGRFSTEGEIDEVVNLLVQHVGRLREMSPLWEMVQEGIDISKIEWSQDAH